MKVRDTSRGRMYAVSSNPGCTVINGDMAVDIPAGGQSVILALDKKLIIDGDDDAKFVEVRWGTNAAVGSRPAPSWIGDVVDGLISIVGADKFDVNYIPAENKLVVHTDRVSDELSEEVTELLTSVVPQDVEVERFNHNIEISWRDFNKYAECKTFKQMYEVDPEKFEVEDLGWIKRYIINDLTSDGDFVYPLTSLVRTENGVPSSFVNVRANPFSLTLPSATDVAWCFQSVWRVNLIKNREFELIAPNATNAYYTFAGNDVYIRKIKCYLPLVTRFDCFARHCYTVEEVEGDFSSASTGSEMFSGTRLNKKSALNVLTSIPSHASGSHPLTIGIHIDHQFDEGVLEAIANAEEKGWTLSVQWNGTPTAQASTFNMGTLIYARMGETENGEKYLDWGHYVTNWEERGYEQFRSLESAYEYFNLSMPEVETEEELQIEEIENA